MSNENKSKNRAIFEKVIRVLSIILGSVIVIMAIFGILAVCASPLGAEEPKVKTPESLVLHVGNDTYTRDMPSTSEEKDKLITDLIDMYNDLNDKHVEYAKTVQETETKNNETIASLENQIKTLDDELSQAGAASASVNDTVDKLTKRNALFTGYTLLGPVIGTDKATGIHIGFMGEYRIFTNFHIGASVFGDVFMSSTSNSRPIDFGCAIVFGYSFN